jgi:hypothetical protein
VARAVRRLLRSAVAALLVAVAPSCLAAQTVVEVQGGGSSLVGGYGATANYWHAGYDGWVGVGYLNGLRLGAFLRTALGKDTLRIGNDAMVLRFPTDLFSTGTNLLLQGVSFTGGSARTSYLLFGGASSDGLAAPSFQAANPDAPLGAVRIRHLLNPRVRVSADAVFARRPTVMPGVQWEMTPDLTTALVAGAGSNRPYAASSAFYRRGDLEVKGSYVWNPSRFRRADVPGPKQAETDRENVQVTYQVSPDFALGFARQNFVQDSADTQPIVRASGNSFFASGRWRDFRLTGGLYDSRAAGVRNLSSYAAAGREIASWLDAEVFVLQSRPEGIPATTTPIVHLRWSLSPRLGLNQQVIFNDGRPTVLFGAMLRTAIGEFGADYQIVHQPFQPFNPFRSTLNLTARLQLGNYSTSLGTYVRQDGSIDYSASGSTFLYMGGLGGIQPQQVGTGGGMGRYVIRGVVRDDGGQPVEGAALDLGGELAFTNSAGEFFVRVRRPTAYDLSVRLEEFLFPGRWEVVSAPARVQAEREGAAPGIEVILRHPAPAPAAPAPAPVVPAEAPAPAIPVVPQSADTLYRIGHSRESP